MTFKIDDKQLDEMVGRYQSRIGDTRYFNLASKIGADSNGYSSAKNEQKEEIVKSIESFFGVYGIVKRFALSYGPTDFSDNFAFYCGSVYGDSLLEKLTNETIAVPRVGLKSVRKHQSESLMINNLLATYVNAVSKATNGNLPKLTRGFFQSIAGEAEQALRKYSQSLEEISKEEIIVGDVKLKGIYFSGKGAVLEGDGEKSEIKDIEPIAASEIKVSFGDIGGNYEAKKETEKIIKEVKNPKVRSFYGRKKSQGIVLHGPPGTGKTMLAKAFASKIGLPFYEVRTEDILDKWFGNTEKNLANLLTKKNVVIFFDEMDSLGAQKGGTESRVIDRVVNLIAVKMDGLGSDNSNIYFAAVNEPDLLDPKLTRPGRFNKAIYVGVPTKPELSDILIKQINIFRNRSDAWNEHEIDVYKDVKLDVVTEAMWEKSLELKGQGKVPVVGADVEEIINRAIEIVEEDAYEGKSRILETRDFLNVLGNYDKISYWKESYEKDVISAILRR